MTTLLINVMLTALPIAAVLIFIINKNRDGGLSVSDILTAFAAGLFVILPASFVEFTIFIYTGRIKGVWQILIQAFVIAALVEELTKFLTLRLIYYIKIDKTYKNSIYIAVAVGLGFAFLENVMYSFDSSIIVMLRSVSAVPLHVFTTGIIGYYLIKRKDYSDLSHYRGLLEAFLLHGFYGMFIALKSGISFLAIAVIIAAGYRFYTLCFSKEKEQPPGEA